MLSMTSWSSMQAMTFTYTAMTTNLDIDIEYAIESLGPRHCDVLVSG